MANEELKTWLEVARKIIPEITEAQVSYVLWEETCYPFNDEIALKQFKEQLEKHKKIHFPTKTDVHCCK